MTTASKIFAQELADSGNPEGDSPDVKWTNLGPLNSQGATGSTQYCGSLTNTQNQGRIVSISVDPDKPKHILAGSANAGVWRTEDGGENWSITTSDEGFSQFSYISMVRHPKNSQIVYASTGITGGTWEDSRHAYGIGIIRSDDGGSTWHKTGLSYDPGGDDAIWGTATGKLAIDPNSTLSNTLLYCVQGSRVKKWEGDASASGDWSTIFEITETYPMPKIPGDKNNDIEVGYDGTVWFCNFHGLFSYKNGQVNAINLPILFPVADSSSCDGGTHILRKGMNIEINKAGDIVVLAVFHDTKMVGTKCRDHWGAYLYRSTDDGDTWSSPNRIGTIKTGYNGNIIISYNLSFQVPILAVDPYNSNKIYIESGRCMSSSQDFGITIDKMDNNPNHGDIRALELGGDGTLYVGTDGGLSKSEDGDHWQDITGQGLSIGMYYGIGISDKEQDMFYAGAQDGSINFYYKGKWFQIGATADNGDALISGENNEKLVYEVQHTVFKGKLNPLDGNITGGGKKNVGSWLNPLHWNPSKPNEFFVGAHKLYQNEFSDTAFNEIFDPVGTNNISSVAVSRKNPNVVYCATDGFFWQDSQSVADGIWRLTRSGDTWSAQDITGNLRNKILLDSFGNVIKIGLKTPITDIAVDPNDEDRIWVTRGMFEKDEKVYFCDLSLFGPGDEILWEQITSEGLRNLPVTAICYQEGTKDRLYVGTDNGVFYKDNEMSEWERLGANGPQCLVDDMEIHHCGSKLMIATYGNGIWEAELLSGNEIVIDNNETWTESRSVLGNVRITPGHTLKITNGAVIDLAQRVNIFVERGATLIVDDATLTNGCGGLWGGIQVWGDASKNQFASEQGHLSVINQSTIEYARNAVKLGKDWDWPIQHTGGIVNASNSTFRNNKRAAEFLKYDFYNPSSFRDCRFVLDEPLPNGDDVEPEKPFAFVTMWAVKGINFVGCDFINENPAVESIDELGSGITTIDAQFSLQGCWQACPNDPCCISKPNTFTNLYFGIYAAKKSSESSFSVVKAKFINCNYGVFNKGVDFFRVELSDFDYGHSIAGDKYTFGIENTEGTQFSIQDNTFKKHADANKRLKGTVMFNTGAENNEIYNNSFNGMFYANQAAGKNVSSDNDGLNGLAYVCNKHTHSKFNIFVHGGVGIRNKQLDMKNDEIISAGNTFTSSGFESDIHNFAVKNILYYWDDEPFHIPTYHTPFPKVALAEQQSDPNTCSSKWDKTRRRTKDELVERYEHHRQKWMANKAYLQSKIDNGHTESLKTEVLNAASNDMALKAELLNLSPYLSTTVLKSMVDAETFSGNTLYEILDANRDAYFQANISKQILEKGLLVKAQVESLNQQIPTTKRGEIEQLVSAHKAKKDWYAKTILQRLLTLPDDEKTSGSFDEELEWMRSFGTLKSSYMVVDHYISYGKYSKAISYLNLIPNQFDLTEAGKEEFGRMKEYMQLLVDLRMDHRTEYQLNSSELATLREMATKEDMAGLRAQNILYFFYHEAFEPWGQDEEINNYTESGGGKNSTNGQTHAVEKENTLITISPNPVSDEFVIKYLSRSIYGNDAQIFILDGSGNIMFKGLIQQAEVAFSLNATGWQPGTYFCVYKSKTGYQEILPFNVSDY